MERGEGRGRGRGERGERRGERGEGRGERGGGRGRGERGEGRGEIKLDSSLEFSLKGMPMSEKKGERGMREVGVREGRERGWMREQ